MTDTDDDTPPSWKFEDQGLVFLPDTTFEEWTKAWAAADRIQRDHLWYIGDALAFGESRFGEQYASVIDGYATETRSQAKWVASKIPKPRRRAGLSYAHHRAVAALPDEQQDELLERAIEENLSSKELGEIVKTQYRSRPIRGYPSNNPPYEEPPVITVDLDENGEDSARNPEPLPTADPRLPEWLEERRDGVELRKREPEPRRSILDTTEAVAPNLLDELRSMIARARRLAPLITYQLPEPWRVSISRPPSPPGHPPAEWVVELRREPGDHFAIGMGESLSMALAEAALSAAILDAGEEDG